MRSEILNKHPDVTELEIEFLFTWNLEKAAALVAELGSFPHRNSSSAAGNRFALWLSHQRWFESLGRLPIERAQSLDHTLPGWRKEDVFDERERQWLNALAAYIARVEELGHLPTGDDPCARWMNAQQNSLKQDTLYEGRERALNGAVPGWKTDSCRHESKQRTDECENTGSPTVSVQAEI